MRIAGTIFSAVLVGIVVLIGTVVTVAGMNEMYGKCGSVCWQALQQVMRNRY